MAKCIPRYKSLKRWRASIHLLTLQYWRKKGTHEYLWILWAIKGLEEKLTSQENWKEKGCSALISLDNFFVRICNNDFMVVWVLRRCEICETVNTRFHLYAAYLRIHKSFFSLNMKKKILKEFSQDDYIIKLYVLRFP